MMLVEKNRTESDPEGQQSTDDVEFRNYFWSIPGKYMNHFHVQPRVKLYLPKGGSFPIPLKYIVVRRTSTTLGALTQCSTSCSIRSDGRKILLEVVASELECAGQTSVAVS